MLSRSAEESFRRGVKSLALRRVREALALFEAAIELQRRRRVESIEARYLSYYGLCIALATDRGHDGLSLCRRAVEQEPYNADLYCNLGRVLRTVGLRREAWQTLQDGIRLDPRHRGLRWELAAMGMRRRPVLRFLRRNHPLNVLLGKSLGRKAVPRPARRHTATARV